MRWEAIKVKNPLIVGVSLVLVTMKKELNIWDIFSHSQVKNSQEYPSSSLSLSMRELHWPIYIALFQIFNVEEWVCTGLWGNWVWHLRELTACNNRFDPEFDTAPVNLILTGLINCLISGGKSITYVWVSCWTLSAAK